MTTDRSAAAPQPQPLLKRVVNALKVAVVPPVGYRIIQMLRRTMTWRTEGSEHVNRLFAEEKRVILAFWHAQQLMMPLAIPGLEAHVLISQHRDGELIRRIVARFGLDAVRGSSTRGGAEAFRQLIRLGRSGGNLVLTPDGPKGPRQVVKVGVVQLARATGLPIIVAVTSLEVGAGVMDPRNAAALVGAGALSVLVFPLLGNSLVRGRSAGHPIDAGDQERAENTA